MKKIRHNIVSVFLSAMICLAFHNAYTPLCHQENPVAGAESEKEVHRDCGESGRTAVRQFSISFRNDLTPRLFFGHTDHSASVPPPIRYACFPDKVSVPSILLSATVLRV
jgi:hypothetical protein